MQLLEFRSRYLSNYISFAVQYKDTFEHKSDILNIIMIIMIKILIIIMIIIIRIFFFIINNNHLIQCNVRGIVDQTSRTIQCTFSSLLHNFFHTEIIIFLIAYIEY